MARESREMTRLYASLSASLSVSLSESLLVSLSVALAARVPASLSGSSSGGPCLRPSDYLCVESVCKSVCGPFSMGLCDNRSVCLCVAYPLKMSVGMSVQIVVFVYGALWVCMCICPLVWR